MDIVQALCQEFHLKTQQCENVLRLIDDGNTIPFIARYRKEQTGSLTTSCCARFTSACSTCAGWTSAAGRSPPRWRSRGISPTSFPTGCKRPPP